MSYAIGIPWPSGRAAARPRTAFLDYLVEGPISHSETQVLWAGFHGFVRSTPVHATPANPTAAKARDLQPPPTKQPHGTGTQNTTGREQTWLMQSFEA